MTDTLTQGSRRAGPPDWQVESLRLTAFLPQGAHMPQRDWWSEVVGTVPDAKLDNPKLSTSRVQGAHAGGTLVLNVQPGRLDWNLSAELSDPADLSESIPSLGAAPACVDQFAQLARRWLEVSPDVVRIAFGAVLIRPVASREEAYALIGQQVPGLRLNTPGCADLLYQINRPRESRVHAGLRLNRLSKWAAVLVSLVQVQLAPVEEATSTDTLHVLERLELDINTEAERREALPAAELGTLFGELVDLGMEIAREGDIP